MPRTGTLREGQTLPLLVEPEGAETGAALVAWIEARRPWIGEQLARHGAILFRGFGVEEPGGFEQVARAIDPELKNDYLGTSPRDALTDYVFSASELPPFYPIPQHIEMSFVAAPPRRLFFSCLRAPSGAGGETPLCDFRRVAADLDPAVRERFASRGVRNLRNYCGPDGGSRFDLWKLKRWDEMFRTTDREEAARIARANGFECRWKAGGRLELANTQPAFRAHPETGETVWFNHAQVFHLSAAAGEYRRIAARMPRVKYRALRRVAQAMVALKSALTAPEDHAMQCTFGDGTPIPDRDMEKLRDAIWKHMVFFAWQQGDVVAIDNQGVSHGRMPYEGPRKIAVCWA